MLEIKEYVDDDVRCYMMEMDDSCYITEKSQLLKVRVECLGLKHTGWLSLGMINLSNIFALLFLIQKGMLS